MTILGEVTDFVLPLLELPTRRIEQIIKALSDELRSRVLVFEALRRKEQKDD